MTDQVKVRDVLRSKLCDHSYKLLGVGWLLQYFKQELVNDEALIGIGVLLQSLADEGFRMRDLIEIADDSDLNASVEEKISERDPISRIERIIRERRAERRQK